MQSFVVDKEANKQINEVYNLVLSGKSDHEIAAIFNDQKIVNLQTQSTKWEVKQISDIREMFKLDSSSPNFISKNNSVSSNVTKKPSIILIILSILIILVTMLIQYSIALQHHLETGKLVGRLISPVLISLMVVGLFQIGKGFRNGRSRVKIFFWTALIVLLGQIPKIVGSVQPPQGAYVPALSSSVVLNDERVDVLVLEGKYSGINGW